MKRNKKLYIILSLIIIVVMMTIGYAAYNQKLNISETSKIDSNFNILITNIEIKEVGGEAINNNDPIYNGLEASFDITFNKKHDYIEYNVEVSNKGTIEAYLNQIKIENEKSKVVSMSYRGINVGDKLSLGESKTFVVRVEYLGGISKGEIDLSLDYSAEENPSGEIILPEANYKVIYNTEENGGEKAEIEEKNYNKGESIDLSNKGKKEGYTFVGWNTNKDSKEAIKELTMGEEDITLYAIYKKAIEVRYKIGDGISEIPKEKDTCEIYNKEEECSIELPSIENIKAKDGRVIDGWYKGTEKITNNTQKVRENSIYEIKAYTDTPAEVEINTSTLSNRIRVVTNITNNIEIEKYEYKIDNGDYIESNNTYSFDALEHNTEHTIKIRVTTIGHAVTEKEITVRTLEIATPTFTEETEGIVKISYPEECNGTYTCTYIKDGGEETPITKNPEEVIFGSSGTLIAKVTDGTNYITSSTYTVERTNLYVSNSGNDTNGYGTKEAPYLTLNKAYDCASLTQESTIYVMNDITVNETTNLDENKTITLTSYSEDDNANSVIKGKVLNDHFLMATQGSLSLENIILDGNNLEDNSTGISMEEGTKINLNNNSIVQNFKNTSSGGGGVRARKDVVVNINGGIIRQNEALSDAGLQTAQGAIINFSSGEISYNKATDSNSGTAGGVAINGGTFTMTGGKISNNEAEKNAGGIYVGNSGGLIGKTYISGGTISNNKAGVMGGGIYVFGSSSGGATLEISGNASINNNAAVSKGGGIFICEGSTLSLSGGTLSQNDATLGHGGGALHIYGSLTMTGGTISNNKASGSNAEGNGNGGGIVIQTTGIADISGGKIINNTSNRTGGGVVVTGNDTQKPTLNISGTTLIDGNTAVISAGGISAWNAVLNISGGIISNNRADQAAGVFYSKSSGTMTGGIIKNNVGKNASGYVGGLAVTSSTFTFKSGIICGNTPTNSYETSATCPS